MSIITSKVSIRQLIIFHKMQIIRLKYNGKGGKIMQEKYYRATRFDNFRELIKSSSVKYGLKNAFCIKEKDGTYSYISYKRFGELYFTLCMRFIYQGFYGKALAITGNNSVEWLLCYLTASTVGVAVPIDKSLSGEDIIRLCGEADCAAIFADNTLTKRILPYSDKGFVHSLEECVKNSPPPTAAQRHEVNALDIPRDKMQVLIFTSGTTGGAKGVCLSQYNICTNIYQVSQIVKITASDKTISLLPLHHTYECTLNCLFMLSRGGCICFGGELATLAADLKGFSPTVMLTVPALLSYLSKRINNAIYKEIAERLAALPLMSDIRREKPTLSRFLSHIPFFLRDIISAKVKNTLGGRLRLIIVGAAAVEAQLIEDFNALGIRTLQGYGLTECSPLLAGNSDFFLDPSSAGRAVPGVALKIINSDENGVGEIAAKGDNIMLGYYNDPAATNEAMINGYFRTGDLGYTDENGALFIKGRIKNVIVTPNGKNIYPEELEEKLLSSEIIAEAIVLKGTDHKGEECVRAKVFPNRDKISQMLKHDPSEREIRDAVARAIKEINELLPTFKRIRLTEITDSEFERTSTNKIKRFGKNVE